MKLSSFFILLSKLLKNKTGTLYRTKKYPKTSFFSMMMEKQQAERIRLRFGLTLKLIMDENKSKALYNSENNIKDRNLIDSYGKLESASGLRKATLIDFASGKVDSGCTTIGAILEAFNMTLSEFGFYYDKITEKDITDYKKSIESSRKEKKG
jgi:hypothetical protein